MGRALAFAPSIVTWGRQNELELQSINNERLHFVAARVNCGVEEFADIQCPFCGQTCEVVIDTGFAHQRFTTDCEICCRPFEVVADCEKGEVVKVEVSSE